MVEVDPSLVDSPLPSSGSSLRLPRRFTGFRTPLATPVSSDPLADFADTRRVDDIPIHVVSETWPHRRVHVPLGVDLQWFGQAVAQTLQSEFTRRVEREQAGDATLDDHVAAEEVRCGRHQPGRQRVETAYRYFRCEQRNMQLLLQADVAVDVVGRQRVLVPVVAQFLDG